jgi:hypothetical protein
MLKACKQVDIIAGHDEMQKRFQSIFKLPLIYTISCNEYVYSNEMPSDNYSCYLNFVHDSQGEAEAYRPTNVSKTPDAQFLFDHMIKTTESLTDFTCPMCGVRDAASGFKLPETLPMVLKMRVGRDKFVPINGRAVKVKRKLLYPLDFKIDTVMYSLFAVQHHTGGHMKGHYTADVLNLEKDVWYHCNDENVLVLKEGPKSMFYHCDGHDTAQPRDRAQRRRRKKIVDLETAYCLYYIKQCLFNPITSNNN